MEQPMKKLVLFIVTFLTMATSAFAQIGSLSSDLVFTPITPCRILDTRLIGPAPGTPIAGGATYIFFTGGVSSFASAGGSATNCGLQTAGLNIAAVAVNFVAVGPSAAGYITVYPAGGVQPTASTLNYTAGEVVANSAIVKVSQTSNTAMNIYSLATTHLVADVTGYYSKPVSVGSLECMTQIPPSQSIADGFATFLNTPNCATGFIATAPYCWNNNYLNVYSTGSGVSGTGGFCSWRNQSGAAAFVFTGITCCRIPGR
jgi:hypothetical protein